MNDWIVLYTKEGTVIMSVARWQATFRKADPTQVRQYASLAQAVVCGRDLSGIVPDAVWVEEDTSGVRRDLARYIHWL